MPPAYQLGATSTVTIADAGNGKLAGDSAAASKCPDDEVLMVNRMYESQCLRDEYMAEVRHDMWAIPPTAEGERPARLSVRLRSRVVV